MPDEIDPVLVAVATLCPKGVEATRCGDHFEHWMVGDFTLDDATLIQLAKRHGTTEDRLEQPTAAPPSPPPWGW